MSLTTKFNVGAYSCTYLKSLDLCLQIQYPYHACQCCLQLYMAIAPYPITYVVMISISSLTCDVLMALFFKHVYFFKDVLVRIIYIFVKDRAG